MVFTAERKSILTQRYAELRKAENRIKDALYPGPRTTGERNFRARKKDGLFMRASSLESCFDQTGPNWLYPMKGRKGSHGGHGGAKCVLQCL